MTIDESITLLKFNNEHIADLKNDDLQQLAEWLEELKSYRASVFSGDMTQTMLKEQYCKAIDDFVEELKDYFVIPHDVRVVEMKAEQLKAGGENEQSI